MLIIRKLYHNYMITIFMAKTLLFLTFPDARRFSMLSPAPLRHSPSYQCVNSYVPPANARANLYTCICCVDYERPGIMKRGVSKIRTRIPHTWKFYDMLLCRKTDEGTIGFP